MSRSPSIVPHVAADQDVYLVVEEFAGRRAWCETAEEDTGRATLMRRLMDGLYEHPTRIVAFNTTEGWSRDVTVEIADELRRRLVEFDEVAACVLKFVERAARR
ncbi:hypothetical protein [Bradyrhizobium sp. WSM1743]|uniref:hypothetical protein n=1 Tax=Bradyrhizobium sp. WSM1743 TaxID=318996 RepID=UPI000487FE93|nr:hypothetical protein [Bradyrhizobium sp. WSM1743]